MAACAVDYWGKDYPVLVVAAKKECYSEMREQPYMKSNFGDLFVLVFVTPACSIPHFVRMQKHLVQTCCTGALC